VTVYLVGAGPGDPDLITVRGLELVRECGALVYDRLVSPELVAEAPARALTIPRGPLSQAEINDLLVELACGGRMVVRLKGGDPFVFGRGGEEALALAEAGVPFEVVPGVSCFSAVPAASGIPVTHRGVATQVTVVAGRSCGDSIGFDPATLARTPGTIVLFMGLERLDAIAAALIEHGKDPATPAAAIANGTRPEQETVVAPLAELAETASGLDSPALVVIGEVVGAGWGSHTRNTSVTEMKPAIGTIRR
jgi:uroporphyrin-III C-methyltransferase